MDDDEQMTYSKAGVDISEEENAIKGLKKHLAGTFSFREGKIGSVSEDIGSFANVIDIGNGNLLAMTTDGVGSKVLIAQELDKYDTIGIDLVAMLVNDLICLGAEPITMVDYLAVHRIKAEIIEEIAKGIYEGARLAGISVVGGETATLKDVITGIDDKGFDIAGAAVGIVKKEKVITGREISPGDIILALPSSGVHSNGLTLARKVYPKEKLIDLLTPTEIYVKKVLDILRDFKVKGIANITGSGFRNLVRLTEYGFLLDNPPRPQEIFSDIQKYGNISDEEMYKTFNMGVGFCIISDEKNSGGIIEKYSEEYKIRKLGKVTEEKSLKIVKNEKEFIL